LFILLDDITNFLYSFVSWLHSLTVLQILGIVSFASIDVLRTLSKFVMIVILKIKARYKPTQFPIHYPKISLLVPAHNESGSIAKTIASILENKYPNKEVIIIDDHSSDSTYKQVSYRTQPGVVKVVRRMEGLGSKAAAINFGALFSTGDILMIMDGDTLIERNALRETAKYLNLPGVVAIAGNVRVLSGDDDKTNILTKSQAYEYITAFELGRRIRLMTNLLIIIPGSFGAFKKEIAKKIGLYDKDTITEDFDLTVKLFKTGGRVLFVPDAIAWTYCPNNWKAWIRQRLRWTHGQISTLMKHRDVITSRNIAYKNVFILSVLDMLFMDIFLLAARMISLCWVVSLYGFTNSLLYVFFLIFIIYFVNELLAICAAGISSPNRSDLKYAYLVPFIIFVYRPIYGFVRAYAYVTAFLKKQIKW
jgi:cellulose synthase/poly-beta-1,6-N-acetylglucosamine synthase-like glycosyltransferase